VASILWATIIGAHVAVISNEVDFDVPALRSAANMALDRGTVLVVDRTRGEVPDWVIHAHEVVPNVGEQPLMSTFTDERCATVSSEAFHVAVVGGLAAILVEAESRDWRQRARRVKEHLRGLADG
jgi:hypothetical protein